MNKLKLYTTMYDEKCTTNSLLIDSRRFAQTLIATMAAARLLVFFLSIFLGGVSTTNSIGMLLYCLLIYLVYYGYKWPLYFWLFGIILDVLSLPGLLALFGGDTLSNTMIIFSTIVVIINTFCVVTLSFSKKTKLFFDTFKEIRAEVFLGKFNN